MLTESNVHMTRKCTVETTDSSMLRERECQGNASHGINQDDTGQEAMSHESPGNFNGITRHP